MNFDRNIWYAPYILLHFIQEKVIKEGKSLSSEEKKYLHELSGVAIMTLGINILYQLQIWIQPVNPDEQSPDVRTMELIKRGSTHNTKRLRDIEVITYEKHSDKSIGEFILEKKLNKIVDPKMIFLCILDKPDLNTGSFLEMNELFQKNKKQNEVYIIAKMIKNDPIYNLVKINPQMHKTLNFNAITATKDQYPDPVIILKRGKTQESQFTNIEVKNPFI